MKYLDDLELKKRVKVTVRPGPNDNPLHRQWFIDCECGYLAETMGSQTGAYQHARQHRRRHALLGHLVDGASIERC